MVIIFITLPRREELPLSGVVYELPNELFALLESGERTPLEVSWKIKHDSWPPTEEERKESRRKFISKYPAS